MSIISYISNILTYIFSKPSSCTAISTFFAYQFSTNILPVVLYDIFYLLNIFHIRGVTILIRWKSPYQKFLWKNIAIICSCIYMN